MDDYRHFAAGLRNVELNSTFIIVHKATFTAELLNYVKLLSAAEYEDGKYHTYFGEIKRLAGSFITFWTKTMDETLKKADLLTNVVDKETLISLIQNTINIDNEMDKLFDEIFFPIEKPEQQKIYDNLVEKYKVHIKSIEEMKAKVEKFYNQEQVLAFANEEFPKSISRQNEVFLYAHTYISMLLADHLTEIKGSIQDTLQRLRKNQRILQEDYEQEYKSLLQQMYDKNKELLMLRRREGRRSKEAAELSCAIEKLHKRVIAHPHQVPTEILQQEQHFYEEKMKQFDQIAYTLIKLKSELENVEREEAIYHSMSTTELPGSKFDCWQNVGENYAQRKKLVTESLIKAAKALLTFFYVTGPNHMLYEDNVGPFYTDVHGHQVYKLESGLKKYHLDCERNLKEIIDEDEFYYDDRGRYVYKDGEKIYKALACSSSFQLGEDLLMKKVTVDCGHSEVPNENCGKTIKDPTDVEMLPRTEPVDITRSLNSEVVRYLWDSVGAVLPHALYDVGMLRPRNPIHFLAHRLLVHKYGVTTAELLERKQEADAYRVKMLRERKEKAVAESKAWKAKQVKRRKPEESDDTQERAAYDKYVATNALIDSLNFYNAQ